MSKSVSVSGCLSFLCYLWLCLIQFLSQWTLTELLASADSWKTLDSTLNYKYFVCFPVKSRPPQLWEGSDWCRASHPGHLKSTSVCGGGAVAWWITHQCSLISHDLCHMSPLSPKASAVSVGQLRHGSCPDLWPPHSYIHIHISYFDITGPGTSWTASEYLN